MKDSRGFTLLELLMVVIIIAILASIALPQYLRTAERSRAGESLTLLASIRSSQMRFNAQNAAFATAAQQCQLDIDIPGTGCAGAPAASTIWTYVVNDAAGHATAARITTGDVIQIDLVNGDTCVVPAANAPIYGLPGGPC